MPQDFLTWRESCHLTEDGRKRFFQAYEQRKATVVTHPVFGYKMSYGRMMEGESGGELEELAHGELVV